MATKTHRGHNGDLCLEHSGNTLVEFFSKAGSLFEKKGTFYDGEAKALDLFKPAFQSDRLVAMKLLFWLRDIRGGSGNKSGFRSCLNWLAQNYPEWVSANITMIPECGRWDDLESLYGTPCERDALRLWSKNIKEGHGLACKWAGRKDNKLRAYMQLPPKEYRQMVVRGTNVVEQQMCAGEWTEINYEHVPSKAMSQYSKAFGKRDSERFTEYKTALEKGEAKINASALFPHDCVRTSKSGDTGIADAQFKALPNFFENVDGRVITVADFSGSMGIEVSGSVTAMDISLGLALYCSDRLGEQNPFYKKFVLFSSESQLIDWSALSFSRAVEIIPRKYGVAQSTNIYKALVHILECGKAGKARKDQYPTALLIVSDMQFNSQCDYSAVETAMKEWDKAEIPRPTLVYWNVAGCAGSQADAFDKGAVLVSGFSPAVVQEAFMRCGDPYKVMLKTLEKYVITVP